MTEHEPTSVEMTPKDMAKSAASKLFDLRILIGGLFTFYGIALTIYSFFTTPEELAKAAGININLWLGLAMLLLGVDLPALGAAVAGRSTRRRPTMTPARPGHRCTDRSPPTTTPTAFTRRASESSPGPPGATV